MVRFPALVSLTLPVLQTYLGSIKPSEFRFLYKFRYDLFNRLVDFCISHNRKEELCCLLDYVDPLLRPKDVPLVTEHKVVNALWTNQSDMVLFLVDRYSFDVNKRCYQRYLSPQCTLLELAYREIKASSGLMNRGFFLQLMKRGSEICKRNSYLDLHMVINFHHHFFYPVLIRDLDTVRVLLTLVSVYSAKRIGQGSKLIQWKLPLDSVRKMKEFLM